MPDVAAEITKPYIEIALSALAAAAPATPKPALLIQKPTFAQHLARQWHGFSEFRTG